MVDHVRIAEALNTVLEINEDDTARVAFFGYAGHMGTIQISIYPHGFSKDPDLYYVFDQYGTTGESDCVIYEHGKKTDRILYNNFDEMIGAVRTVGI